MTHLRRGPRRRPVVALLAVLPWSWFGLRDSSVLLEWVAILLPLAGAGTVVLLVTIGVVRRAASPLVLAASTAVVIVLATVGPWTPQATPPPSRGLRLVAANVLGDNPRVDAVSDDLLSAGADVLVVSEASPALAPLHEQLDAAYPYRYQAGGQDHVGVWSVHPLDGRDLADEGPVSAARGGRVVVRAPFGAFALYAVHLYRPSRDAFRTEVTIAEQDRLVTALDALVRADELPAVVAGDLNVSDRQRAYRRLTDARVDAMRTGWTGPTSLRPRNRPLLLRIDHVLAPGDWCAADARRSGLTGSDHRAVSTSLGPCRGSSTTTDADPGSSTA